MGRAFSSSAGHHRGVAIFVGGGQVLRCFPRSPAQWWRTWRWAARLSIALRSAGGLGGRHWATTTTGVRTVSNPGSVTTSVKLPACGATTRKLPLRRSGRCRQQCRSHPADRFPRQGQWRRRGRHNSIQRRRGRVGRDCVETAAKRTHGAARTTARARERIMDYSKANKGRANGKRTKVRRFAPAGIRHPRLTGCR